MISCRRISLLLGFAALILFQGVSLRPAFAAGVRELPVLQPEQITFEPDAVVDYAVSSDERRLAYIVDRGGERELWLRDLGLGGSGRPERIALEAGNPSSIDFSPDGSLLVIIGDRQDVKGDLYLFHLAEKSLQRLTDGSTIETTVGFLDDTNLMLTARSASEGRYSRVRLNQRNRLASREELGRADALAVNGTGAGMILHGLHLSPATGGGPSIELLQGVHLFPALSRQGILVTSWLQDTNGDGAIDSRDRGVIWHYPADGGMPAPLTAADLSSVRPRMAGSHLYYLALEGAGGNIRRLPVSGMIPAAETRASLLEMIAELAAQIPPRPELELLARYRFLREFPDAPEIGAVALRAGELASAQGRGVEAVALYRLLTEGLPQTDESAGIARVRLAELGAPVPGPLLTATDPPVVHLEAALIRARRDAGGDLAAQKRALEEIDHILADPAGDELRRADSLLLRLRIYLSRGVDPEPTLIELIRSSPGGVTQIDDAITLYLDHLGADAGESGRIDHLRKLVARYRSDLPVLAMAALNRIGDLHVAADAWSRAKDAYLEVLNGFSLDLPQRSAARFALAEIFYREERFSQAIALYEEEMIGRSYADQLYRLARFAYLDRSLAAAERLFRLGEVPAARARFAELIDSDPGSIEAHRGYITAVAAMGGIEPLIARYRAEVAVSPDDAPSRYRLGLALTYRDSREALLEAREALLQAIGIDGGVEYFHQTLGYVEEVLESVHGMPDRLESAMDAYLRAYHLNDPRTNSRNRANLALNLGNVSFLLGQPRRALDFYTRRLEMGLPFDLADTELIFHYRTGIAAFRSGENDIAVAAFRRALALREEISDPLEASRRFDGVIDSVRTLLREGVQGPAEQRDGEEEAAIAEALHQLTVAGVSPPPAASWGPYARGIEGLVERQRALIDRLLAAEVAPSTAAEGLGFSLDRVSAALRSAERAGSLATELRDRLGLALIEQNDPEGALEAFKVVLQDRRQGDDRKNLASSLRNVGYSAYLVAQTATGGERVERLLEAQAAFTGVLDAVAAYGVVQKEQEGSGISLSIALDDLEATGAATGFSATQERNIAERYLARIAAELNDLPAAEGLIKKRLAKLPADRTRIAPADRLAAALLLHQAGQLAFAAGDLPAAVNFFAEALEINLLQGSAVAARYQIGNLTRLFHEGLRPDSVQASRLLSLFRQGAGVMLDRAESVPPLDQIRLFNDLAIAHLSLGEMRDTAGRGWYQLEAARFAATARERFAVHRLSRDEEVQREGAKSLINLAILSGLLGGSERDGYLREAAEVAGVIGGDDLLWRIACLKGEFEESLRLLDSLSPWMRNAAAGEILRLFAPHLRELAQEDPEGGFLLAEELLEQERLHHLAAYYLNPLGEDDRRLLRDAAGIINDLQALGARRAAADSPYLEERNRLLEAKLDSLIGGDGSLLPQSIRRVAGDEISLRNALLLALGSAPMPGERGALGDWVAARNQLPQQGAGRRLLTADPTEALPLMDLLPDDGRAVLVVPAGDGESALFRVTLDGVEAEILGEESLRVALTAEGVVLIAGAWPEGLPAMTDRSLASSATCWLRAKAALRPFRGGVVDRAEKSGEPGKTLLFSPDLQLRWTPPTSAGKVPQPGLRLWGETPLENVLQQNGDLALVLIPEIDRGVMPLATALLDLWRIPTLIAGEGLADAGVRDAFFAEYADLSALEALDLATDGGSTGKVSLNGFAGMSAIDAAAVAAKGFADTVKGAAAQYQEGEYRQALAGFERGVRLIDMVPRFSNYRIDLLTYARESAFLAGDQQRALHLARALVELLHQSEDGSERHARELATYGILLSRNHSYAEAVAVLEEAAGMQGDMELPDEQVNTLAEFGVVLENAVRYQDALTTFAEVVSLSEELDRPELLAEQYRNIGRIYDLRLNNYAKGIESYRTAIRLWEDLDRPDRVGQLLVDVGRCQRLLGNLQQAAESYRQGLDLLDPASPEGEVARLEMANLAWYRGEYQQALDGADAITREDEERGHTAVGLMARNTGGLTWWTLGDYRRALGRLEEALRIARTSERPDEEATTLNNLGLVLRDQGELDAALLRLGEALAIDRRIGSLWGEAYDLKNLALTRQKMGDTKGAAEDLQLALKLARRIGNRINEAKILLAQGDLARQTGDLPGAETAYLEALALADARYLREVSWRCRFGLGELARATKDLARAVAELDQATRIIESMRAEIAIERLRDGFVADKQDAYAALVLTLLDLGRDEDAFAVAERARSRNLLDLLGNQRLGIRGKEGAELAAKLDRIKGELREAEGLIAGSVDDAEREAYRAIRDRVQLRYDDLLLDIERADPEAASVISVEPLDLAGVQQLLDASTLLLSYFVAPQETVVWLVRNGSVEVRRVKVDRDDLEERILAYRRMVQNLDPVATRSRELFALLLAPVAAELQGAGRVGIIPHGPLHYLSFATLEDGSEYLIDRYPLFYLPSASVLKYSMERRRPAADPKVLAVGNPDRGRALDLPFAAKEVAALGWNFRNVTLLQGERATEGWVREHIGEFGIIHLASHGEFDPVNPLFSRVLLAKDGSADGDLEASEIFDLQINADLVVLSACQTGLGKVTGGDEVLGMNRALLYAGTHALVSSLWRVSDVTTALLMKSFYRRYQEGEKASTLRRAMLHVKNRYPHPGYWGAFLLSGDYQ